MKPRELAIKRLSNADIKIGFIMRKGYVSRATQFNTEDLDVSNKYNKNKKCATEEIR